MSLSVGAIGLVPTRAIVIAWGASHEITVAVGTSPPLRPTPIARLFVPLRRVVLAVVQIKSAERVCTLDLDIAREHLTHKKFGIRKLRIRLGRPLFGRWKVAGLEYLGAGQRMECVAGGICAAEDIVE